MPTDRCIPDYLALDFVRTLKLKRRVGEHERAHAGEIATILMGRHWHSDLAIIDDNWGSDLARRTYGLEVMSTARLAVEMAGAGYLSEDTGFRVFDSATPPGVGRDRYERALCSVK